MQISGQVLAVRPNVFKSKSDPSQLVEMLYLDVYDETAKMVSCETMKNGVVVEVGARIVADVTRLKKQNFGDGILVKIANVKPQGVVAMPPPPASAPVPPPFTVPPSKK